MQKYEICNHCHGNGAESLSDLEKCNECNGSGKLRTKKRTIFGSETIVETVCYKCNGKGQIITKKCSTC
ncbi:molecular chaperone DnaJ, partial [Mycoplasmopsis pullorum]